jgi:hypothetical protein
MPKTREILARSESKWICDQCESPCNNSKVQKLEVSVFEKLIFALSYDLRLFLGLSFREAGSTKDTLCLIRCFFFQAALIKKPPTIKQKYVIKEYLKRFIVSWSENPPEFISNNTKKQFSRTNPIQESIIGNKKIKEFNHRYIRLPPLDRIVVDGNNVARTDEEDKGASSEKLIRLYKELRDPYKFKEIIIVISAAFKHNSKDFNKLSRFIKRKIIRETPAGASDDYFIIQQAIQMNALILTNDLFRDWKKKYPELKDEIEKRRVTFFIDSREESFILGEYPEFSS